MRTRELLRDERALRVALLSGLLWATQVVVTVRNPFSLGGGKALPLAEIPMVLVALALAVWWSRHRDAALDRDDRFLVIGALVFAAALVLISALRVVLDHRHAVSTTSVEVTLCGIAFYFLLRRGWFHAVELVLAIHVLLVLAELTALLRVVAHGTTLRMSAPLTNANMYVGLALLVLPVLVWFGVNTTSKVLRWSTIAQLAVVVAFVALSGSRFGGVALILELLLVLALVDHRPWSRRLLDAAASAAICLALMAAVIAVSPETSADFRRTLNVGSAVAMEEPPSAGDQVTSVKDWSQLPRVMGGGKGPLPTSPGRVDRGDPDVDVWTSQRSLRPRLWPRALRVAREHWALGTGRPVIFYYGYGYETPHSVVFDPVISMGVFGALVLWILLLWVPLSLVRQIRSSRSVRALVLGCLLLLAFSLFQPLIDSVLVLGLVYFGLYAVVPQRGSLGPSHPSRLSPRAARRPALGRDLTDPASHGTT